MNSLASASLLILPLQSLRKVKWRKLNFGSLFLFQNWVLEEKIIWKTQEASLGKTFSDKYLEHPIFCTLLPFHIVLVINHLRLYKINPFIWWRGKCHSLTITERNVLCTIGLGLPQNIRFQMLNCFFRSLVKVPEH